MLLQVGLRGMEGRLWWRYQAKILWPNFWGELEAPAMAKVGEEKNFAAAVRMSDFWEDIVGSKGEGGVGEGVYL